MTEKTREEAWAILTEFTQGDSLLKHALAVEAAMRHYARKLDVAAQGESEDVWGIVGLLHDFDYEQHPTPEEHPFVGVEILRGKGYDEETLRAILAHADYSGVAPESLMEKALCAVDELCGFITAVTLVRPSKSILDVTIKSVKKKMKSKAFAANVSRDDMNRGADLLGLPIEEHIQNVIAAMQTVAAELGLE